MDNNFVTEQPQAPKRNFLVPFLIILVLVAAVELFLLMQKSGKFPSAVSTVKKQEVMVPDQEGVAEGAFNVSAGNKSDYTVSAPFTVTLTADSNGRGVVGFDAVFQYDTTALTAGSVSSSVAGFSATSNMSKGYLDVTSTKDSEKILTPIFKNTDVLVLTFTPKKKGSFTINLLNKIDNSSTKFIDDNTKIYLPKVNSVTVSVK